MAMPLRASRVRLGQHGRPGTVACAMRGGPWLADFARWETLASPCPQARRRDRAVRSTAAARPGWVPPWAEARRERLHWTPPLALKCVCH